jgi:hypothetical protein
VTERTRVHIRRLSLVVIAAMGVLTTPGLVAQICVNCGGPVGFRVHAFDGLIARNGGKCLDYQPEVVGSPVVLSDCTVAHAVVVHEIPNQQHQVFLRAGTKVIGVRRPPLPVPGDDIDDGSSTGVPVDPMLELQNPGVLCTNVLDGPWCVADQTFALDGDSIRLASNHQRVVKVLNGRGANGTPIVLGAMALDSAEFWDFRAVDGGTRAPTSAFVTVSTLAGLLERLVPYGSCEEAPAPCPALRADAGTVITIDGSIEVEGSIRALGIPEGVTIRGDRRGVNLGGELRKLAASQGADTLLGPIGNNVRITNLRLLGPNRSSDGGQEVANAILVEEQLYQGTVIDHNDISDWPWRGVWVKRVDESSACTDPSDPRGWPAFTWVARNFIHHNRAYEKGYGVNANAGAFPLIDGNVFVENRHAIAGTEATAHTGYRAWHNLVLSAVPLQRSTFYTHDFDMHGRGSGGKGGRAGGYVDLYRNTFLGTTRANFEIRGTPCNFVDVRNNVFLQERRDALSLDVGILGSGSVTWVIPPAPRQFDQPDPAREFGVGDFDGDGVQDLFLATGSAWYYSPQGVAEWRLLNDNPDRLDTLLFGDFDGDGRTDVLGKNGRRLVASWGGASDWDTVNEIDATMRDLAVGDFDASGQADIFHADGHPWFVAYDNRPFVEVNTSSFRVNQLRFGDFDGSGTTDVFGVGSRDWQVSYSATSGWDALRRRLTNTTDSLHVADFDGNGTADVALVDTQASRYRWRVSRDGIGNWVTLISPTLTQPAAIGAFVPDDPRASLLVWSAKTLWRATYAEAPVRHARQDMR